MTPPVISIFNPQDGETFSHGQKKIIYEVQSPAGAAPVSIEVLLDGKSIGTRRGLERSDEVTAAPGATVGQIIVPLPDRNVTVSLVAHAGTVASAPATVKLVWAGPAVGPKVYALIVGVSRYADKSLALEYAAKDATDFATALQAQSGGLYADVQTRILTDADATRRNVITGLQWLNKQVTSNDLGIVYIAGHGWTDDVGSFWFLPVNATPEDLDLAIAKDDILRPMEALAGKALLFIDACHAAATPKEDSEPRPRSRGVDMDAVIRDFSAAARGIVTFASSQGREPSLERADWGNGAFTKALVEGLGQGKAAVSSGEITLTSLNYFVVTRVKELTGGLQHPVVIQNGVPDFPIGIVRLATAPAKPELEQDEIVWSFLEKSGTRDQLLAFIKQFPDSRLVAAAKAKLAGLPGTAGDELEKPAAQRPAGRSWRVHLVSGQSEFDARNLFEVLQKRYPDELSDAAPEVRPTGFGATGQFAVSIGAPSRDDATRLCGRLLLDGTPCFVFRN